MNWGVILGCLAIFAAFSGCNSPEQGQIAVPPLVWSGYRIETTPLEPFEQAGANFVHYDELYAYIYNQNEDSMPRYVIKNGDTLYYSNFQRGWIKTSMESFDSQRAYRYDLWDIRGMLDSIEKVTEIEEGFSYATSHSLKGVEYSIDGTVTLSGVQATKIVMNSNADLETPYTFTPTADGPANFTRGLPDKSYSVKQAESHTEAARAAQTKILGWISAYVDQNRGNVPPAADEDTLLVQRGLESWPLNPFTDQKMVVGDRSGDIFYKVCTPTTARFAGFGVDGATVGRAFGSGC